MSKKVRRVRRTTKTEKGQAGPAVASPTLTPEEEFRQEYAYVIKDLRRVFILAVIMFGLLIALNVLLR